MKTDTVSISMDTEKLRAIKRYMGKKEADLEQEMVIQLQRLYEKYVPSNVREYIDENEDGQPTPPPRRPARENNG